MFRGIVQWFDSKKQYGVAVLVGSGTEVFLRFGSGGQIITQDGLAMISNQRKDLRPPKSGDELVLETRQTAKGTQAKHWGFASAYDAVVRTLPEVRLLMGATLSRGDQSLALKPASIWRGRDLRELDDLPGLSKPLRPGQRRTGWARTSFFGCTNQANYRLEVMIEGRWRRYERSHLAITFRDKCSKRTRVSDQLAPAGRVKATAPRRKAFAQVAA